MLITTSSSDIDASLPSRFLVLEMVEGDTLADRLSTNSPTIATFWSSEQLLSGTYEPQPEKRVEIPKPDGGMRKLGIPRGVNELRAVPLPEGEGDFPSCQFVDLPRPPLHALRQMSRTATGKVPHAF